MANLFKKYLHKIQSETRKIFETNEVSYIKETFTIFTLI